MAFQHPLAGKQLVKGTIEAGESAKPAAARELCEESGLRLDGFTFMAATQEIVHGQEWLFYHYAATGLPERWPHHCADDGGHDFRFFWHPLTASTKGWHPVFSGALPHVRGWLMR